MGSCGRGGAPVVMVGWLHEDRYVESAEWVVLSGLKCSCFQAVSVLHASNFVHSFPPCGEGSQKATLGVQIAKRKGP